MYPGTQVQMKPASVRVQMAFTPQIVGVLVHSPTGGREGGREVIGQNKACV